MCDPLEALLNGFAAQNPSVDIRVITPHERYITEFLAWYMKLYGV